MEQMPSTAAPRVFVDPVEREKEEAFQRMMSRFRAMSKEEYVRDGIARGVLNADGSPKEPEGLPCVSRV